MARARRAKNGRFTKRKSTRYSTRKRSTRKGQPRRTARLAYSKKRQGRVSRRRRSNPTMFTPATRYALWATGGGVAGAVADTQTIPGVTDAAKMVPGNYVTNSTVLAALTIALAQFVFKGDNKRNLTAAGVGMLVPTLYRGVQNLIPTPGGAHGYIQSSAMRRVRAPQAAYSNPYISASQGLNVA